MLPCRRQGWQSQWPQCPEQIGSPSTAMGDGAGAGGCGSRDFTGTATRMVVGGSHRGKAPEPFCGKPLRLPMASGLGPPETLGNLLHHQRITFDLDLATHESLLGIQGPGAHGHKILSLGLQ